VGEGARRHAGHVGWNVLLNCNKEKRREGEKDSTSIIYN
jgi:hypothetical protein